MHNENGFSLIEILVSIFLLSIGLLGAANLQIKSLQLSQSAYLRTQATILAYDIADRMRSNPEGVKNNHYLQSAATFNTCISPTGCSAKKMARHDLQDWQQNVARILPDGSGVLCIDSTPSSPACDHSGSAYSIRINWIDDRSGRHQSYLTAVEF